MFIRINTLRINCDAIALYEPKQDARVSSFEIIIGYTSGEFKVLKFNNGYEMIKVLKKLDELFEIKENLASRLPKREE